MITNTTFRSNITMKIQPSNKRDIINSPITKLDRAKPAEISDSEWEEVNSWARSTKDLSKLQAQIKDTAYRRYYQEYSFQEIADWLSVESGRVIFTAIADNWFSKVKSERRVRESSSMEKTDKTQKELLHGILDATLCVYERQLKRAIEDPDAASECGLIPKNLKELQTLMLMVQSMQSKEIPTSSPKPSVTNISVQNLISSPSQSAVMSKVNEAPKLEAPVEDEEDGEDGDALSFLLKAKNGG